MRLSPTGLLFLEGLEAWRPRIYLDDAGKETIGFGHLLTTSDPIAVWRDSGISRATGGDLLRRDVAVAEEALNRLVKVDLEQHQFDALICLVFNIGSSRFATSSVLAEINACALDSEVEAHWKLWNKVRDPKTRELRVSDGLVARRERELKLWQGEA